MRKKSVYRKPEPHTFDHPVSAVFDEPYISPVVCVLRWWYGKRSEEMRGATPHGFEYRRQAVQDADLETMERYVWGCPVKAPDVSPPGPEFWKQVAQSRDNKHVR